VQKFISEITPVFEKLIENIHEIKNIVDIEKDEIDEIHKTLNSLKTRLNRSYCIAIMGLQNSGKSTFINALLGEDICETNNKITTWKIEELHYGKEKKSIINSDIKTTYINNEFLKD